MNRKEIVFWLKEEQKNRLEELWHQADTVRRESVGDEVHLRGLIEISNHCVRRCGYCGLRSENRKLQRYRMNEEEIMACVIQAEMLSYGTVVLQSGEDDGIRTQWLARVIRQIKTETSLAVTLSLGERSDGDLKAWRKAGADRYLLRFETSDPALYRLIHPSFPGRSSHRIEIVKGLRRMGYQIGSGVMIGIPGQTYESLAADIETFRALDLDMVGVGPYIPHPETPVATGEWKSCIPDGEQVPNTEEMTYKVISLTRIICPEANIPSTTALATINRELGRELGLMRGANVVMPNLTPSAYRASYEVYPAKACLFETASDFHAFLRHRIESMGRKLGKGRGDRIHRVDSGLPLSTEERVRHSKEGFRHEGLLV